jgi:polar amino acid transport system substrate-binding protein
MVALVLLAAVTGCAGERTGAVRGFRPVERGVLTVATAELPAPGFWEDDGRGGYQGFEADLATELAGRLGLDRVEVVRVPFADIVAGELGRADVAISQLTPTRDRDRVLDFTGPYLAAAPGVLVRPGTPARDLAELRELRWVVMASSLLTPVVTDRVRPAGEPQVVATRSAALAALGAGEADAMLLDLPVARALAAAEPDHVEVAAQLTGREALAVALPDGAANHDAVDAALRSMVADGTLTGLADRWLGGDGADVPLIRTTR